KIDLGGASRTITANTFTNSPTYDYVLSAAVSGTGGLTFAGGNYWAVNGANTYTGPTVVNSTGNNFLAATNTLPSTTALTVTTNLSLAPTSNVGGVVPGNYSQSIGSLAGPTAGVINLGTATLTTGNDNTDTTFSGNLTGSGGLTKVGSGTQ